MRRAGSQEETSTVNALGETLTMTDRNGSTHALTYDVLGRILIDAVTTLGTGVDGSVRRIEYAYDGQGNQYLITTYDAASGGSIVNQVEREFNGLGQMTVEYQQSGGAVNTSTSPKVQYTYDEMPSGADQRRLTSITYPDGYVLTYNYSSGLNSTISRLSSLSDSSGTLESYSYMGLGTVVVRSHPQINVDLTYVGTPGDAGDEYAGLDRFGRVIDQLWVNTSTSTTLDDFTYDDLSQLTGFTQGTHTQDFNYDAVGNATSVTTDGTEQDRTANAQNQITSISGATTPTYDANGNMLTDETGRQFVFDAWNHLVIVKSSGGTTLETFTYDGLGRRVTSNDGTTTTDLFYSSQQQVLEEMQGGSATARYVWSPVYVNALVLRDRATGSPGTLDERLWAQQDANFNVTALVDGSGAVVERYVYDPYGAVTIYSPDYSTVRSSSSYAMTILFQGMRYDATSGLYEADARWYSASLQRWVSLDPKRYSAADVNLYRAMGNNTTRFSDPLGTEYDPWNWSWWNRQGIRVVGGVQVVGGVAAFAGGIVSSPFTTAEGGPFGLLTSAGLMWVGQDLVVHGSHAFWYGEYYPTWGNQCVVNLTGSQSAGNATEFGESVVGGARVHSSYGKPGRRNLPQCLSLSPHGMVTIGLLLTDGNILKMVVGIPAVLLQDSKRRGRCPRSILTIMLLS